MILLRLCKPQNHCALPQWLNVTQKCFVYIQCERFNLHFENNGVCNFAHIYDMHIYNQQTVTELMVMLHSMCDEVWRHVCVCVCVSFIERANIFRDCTCNVSCSRSINRICSVWAGLPFAMDIKCCEGHKSGRLLIESIMNSFKLVCI